MRARPTATADQDRDVAVTEAAIVPGHAPSPGYAPSRGLGAETTEHTRRERLADVLAEIRAELGPATEEETAEARSVLGL